ncbi:MAG: 16S rRNA (adenine(1518)-N(6)/adenine(1519)-N(6))-dimethyltransferase RsmA [bacterium]|nr:16S rRNA (adenine(1518)-N(6)/adenine(1519)-N(6))-dimethyltransferase RsmA [bacterium]
MKPQTKKRFGQHFLADPSVLSRIITAAEVTPQDAVLEIGPGQGVLTEKLLGTKAQVTVIEIDWDLVAFLKQRFVAHDNFTLVEGDALKRDWAELLGPGSYKLVANLPYNISTPLFFKFLEERQRFSTLVVMLQKEVGVRMLHSGREKPLKEYGILSVAAQLGFEVSVVAQVPPGAFRPPPKVDSVVLQLTPKGPLGVDETAFFRFVKNAFNQRRKLLLSRLKKEEPALVAQLSPDWVERLEGIRPENLLPSEWLELFKQFSPDGRSSG